MPTIQRSERIVTAAGLSALDDGALGLVTNIEPRAVILPLQIIAIPRMVSPFIGEPNSQIWIGTVQVAEVAGFASVMNDNWTLNLLGAASIVPISGRPVADLLGSDLALKINGTLVGGDGIITIVTVYHLVYPSVPN